MIPAVLVGPLIRAGVYALVAASLFGAGAYWMHGRATVKYDKLNAEYSQFKGGVVALGTAAEQAAAKRKLLDIKAKEYADAKTVTDLAAARGAVARLRADADRARGRGMPPAPAGSKCPEGQVCFDSALFERAERTRRESVRGLVDEGTALGVNLNIAFEWANGRMP